MLARRPRRRRRWSIAVRSTSPSTTASAPSSWSSLDHRPASACGRATATRRPRSSPSSWRPSRPGLRRLAGPVVLDGEMVALDAGGRPAGFQRLQGRIHVAVPGYRSSKPQPHARRAARGVHRVRSAARRRGTICAAMHADRAARARSKRCSAPPSTPPHAAPQRAGGGRRPRASTPGPRRRAGKAWWSSRPLAATGPANAARSG